MFICFMLVAVFSFIKEAHLLADNVLELGSLQLVGAYLIFLIYQVDPLMLGLVDLNWLTAIRGRFFNRVPQMRHTQSDLWWGWIINHP